MSGNTKIIKSSIIDESKKDLIKYSIKVNRQRMIPDRRDGLKPVHRRILDIMYNRLGCINHTIKSARIVGEVVGVSHPHGDSSVYDAMKPMANWFEIKIPLITPQGQFGGVQGDGAAAPRYTEAKVSKYAVDCIISDLKDEKNVVDWLPTYDETNMEPEFFPVSVPNLLINGAFGIGFGMKSEIPKHNLVEVIDATINLIKNPDADVVLVPDHCMPVEIVDTNFKAICNKGRGSYVARGIIDIEDGPRDTKLLVIKSMPDLVFLPTIQKKIESMAKSNMLQISDVYDKSDEFNLRYTIQLKKGIDPYYARDLIYKRTNMEKTYFINFEVLDKLEPVRMSYKSYLQSFIEFRKTCKFRLYCNKLQHVDTKIHEKDVFIKVLQSGEIDNIINNIKKNANTNDSELVEYLIDKLDITDLQASYIINANIKKLSIGYLNKYLEEAAELTKLKDEYMAKILNEELLVREIIGELEYYKKKYGSPRTSKIISRSKINNIPEGTFRVIFTENNFVKKLPENFGNGSFSNDRPKHIITGNNTQSILVFDENGRVFSLPIHRIHPSDKSSNGIDIRQILKKCTSNIVKVIYLPTIEELSKSKDKYYITVLASNGNIKKMDLEDFLKIPSSGMLYSRLDKDVFIKSVDIYHGALDIIVYNRKKAIRINMNDIPHQRRNTKGMKSISSSIAEGMSLVLPGSKELLIITDKGFINRIDIVALPTSTRNQSGNQIIKLGKGDSINTIHAVNDKHSTVKVATSGGDTVEVNISDINQYSSRSKGDKLISVKSGHSIIKTGVK